MPRSSDRPASAARLARSELIGLEASVAASNDPGLLSIEGTVVDETRGTLTIRTGERRRMVGKTGNTFRFTVGGRAVLLEGSDLAYRPEDRIKKAKVKR